MDIEVVDRPGSSSSLPDELIMALVETRESGKAVKVKIEGSLINWQSNVRNRLKKENLRLRYKFDKASKTITAWVEDMDGTVEG